MDFKRNIVSQIKCQKRRGTFSKVKIIFLASVQQKNDGTESIHSPNTFSEIWLNLGHLQRKKKKKLWKETEFWLPKKHASRLDRLHVVRVPGTMHFLTACNYWVWRTAMLADSAHGSSRIWNLSGTGSTTTTLTKEYQKEVFWACTMVILTCSVCTLKQIAWYYLSNLSNNIQAARAAKLTEIKP